MAGFIPLPFANDCTSLIDIDADADDDVCGSGAMSPSVEDLWDLEGLLPTPPYSPCGSSSADSATAAAPEDGGHDDGCCKMSVVRRRCSSFLCSCMACECCCSARDDGPVLRDCMWSATTGLFPPPSVRREPSTASSGSGTVSMTADYFHKCPSAVGLDVNGNELSTSCPVMSKTSCPVSQASSSFGDHLATRCVDPKTIFPYPPATERNAVAVCSPAERSMVVAAGYSSPSSGSVQSSVVFDPDSETSTCCSSLSDDDMDEIDVVSVASVSRLSIGDHSSSSSASPIHHQSLLVLPAAESMSAQVAAIHNYSTTRCQPAQSVSSRLSNSNSSSFHASSSGKCTKQRTSLLKTQHRPKRSKARLSGSEDDDSGFSGTVDERCRRAQHNVMERQRRHHLKGNFFGLRDAVPSLRSDHKVSKVTILRAGAKYVGELTATHEALIAERNRLRALQQRWKWKLSLLHRELRLSMDD
jgi:hypothetical protein